MIGAPPLGFPLREKPRFVCSDAASDAFATRRRCAGFTQVESPHVGRSLAPSAMLPVNIVDEPSIDQTPFLRRYRNW